MQVKFQYLAMVDWCSYFFDHFWCRLVFLVLFEQLVVLLLQFSDRLWASLHK